MDEHYDDIDILIAKFLAGEATPDEAMQLEDWMNASTANREVFELAQATWGTPPAPDVHRIRQTLPLHRKNKLVFLTPIRIAAGLLLLAVTSVVVYNVLQKALPEEKFLTQKSFEHPVSFSLPEKSAVTLNKTSSLRYAENFPRKVYLTGEAYFNVAPDPLKPFVIHAEDLEIKVLGTSFNVSGYGPDSTLRVQVVHGKVQMKHLRDSAVLQAGDQGIFHKQTKKIRVIKTETNNNLGYATHEFEYTDKPLSEILDDLASAYDVTFEVEKASVKECRLTGEYRGMTFPVILEVITKSLDLTYTINGNRVYISGDGCL